MELLESYSQILKVYRDKRRKSFYDQQTITEGNINPDSKVLCFYKHAAAAHHPMHSFPSSKILILSRPYYLPSLYRHRERYIYRCSVKQTGKLPDSAIPLNAASLSY